MSAISARLTHRTANGLGNAAAVPEPPDELQALKLRREIVQNSVTFLLEEGHEDDARQAMQALNALNAQIARLEQTAVIPFVFLAQPALC